MGGFDSRNLIDALRRRPEVDEDPRERVTLESVALFGRGEETGAAGNGSVSDDILDAEVGLRYESRCDRS